MFRPKYYANDIFSVNPEFYKENGYEYVLSDLDNTLDIHYVLEPSQRVVELKKELEKNNIKLIIVSNNKEIRKGIYPKRLGVEGIFTCLKPLPFRIKKYLRENNIDYKKCILVGDQLVTDILCSKLSKIDAILTEPISKIDQWSTHINRLIDRPIRAIMKKCGILEKVRIDNVKR